MPGSDIRHFYLRITSDEYRILDSHNAMDFQMFVIHHSSFVNHLPLLPNEK